MKFSKKRLCLLISSVLILAVIARIVVVNYSAYPVDEEIYQIGEWVNLDGDFFFSENEGTDNYSVRVSSAEVLSYAEFMERFGKSADYLADKSQHSVVVLKVDFKNDGDDPGGVFIRDSNLINEKRSARYDKDDTYMKIANPSFTSDLFGITVQPHTEASMWYVYTTSGRADSVTYLDEIVEKQSITMFLNVSRYPTQKLVELHLDTSCLI